MEGLSQRTKYGMKWIGVGSSAPACECSTALMHPPFSDKGGWPVQEVLSRVHWQGYVTCLLSLLETGTAVAIETARFKRKSVHSYTSKKEL